MKYSYSKLMDYQGCPFYFKSRYVDEVPCERNSELTLGVVAHDILREYAMKCHEANQRNLFDQWEAIAERIFAQHSATNEQESEVRKSVENFVRSNEVELRGLVGVEEKIAVRKDMTQTGWDAEDAFFRMKIDMLYVSSNYAKVLDYKTGFCIESDWFQLEIYGAMVMLLYPQVESCELELDFTRFNIKQTRMLNRDDIAIVLKKVMRRIIQIQHDRDFKPVVSGKCSRCPYWSLCPAIKQTGIDKLPMPKDATDAGKLLDEITTLDKKLREYKKLLKMYVKENGTVTSGDVLAEFRVSNSFAWDVVGLMKWAVEEGKDISQALAINLQKLKRAFSVDVVPKNLYAINQSARFFIGKAEDDEEDD